MFMEMMFIETILGGFTFAFPLAVSIRSLSLKGDRNSYKFMINYWIYYVGMQFILDFIQEGPSKYYLGLFFSAVKLQLFYGEIDNMQLLNQIIMLIARDKDGSIRLKRQLQPIFETFRLDTDYLEGTFHRTATRRPSYVDPTMSKKATKLSLILTALIAVPYKIISDIIVSTIELINDANQRSHSDGSSEDRSSWFTGSDHIPDQVTRNPNGRRPGSKPGSKPASRRSSKPASADYDLEIFKTELRRDSKPQGSLFGDSTGRLSIGSPIQHPRNRADLLNNNELNRANDEVTLLMRGNKEFISPIAVRALLREQVLGDTGLTQSLHHSRHPLDEYFYELPHHSRHPLDEHAENYDKQDSRRSPVSHHSRHPLGEQDSRRSLGYAPIVPSKKVGSIQTPPIKKVGSPQNILQVPGAHSRTNKPQKAVFGIKNELPIVKVADQEYRDQALKELNSKKSPPLS